MRIVDSRTGARRIFAFSGTSGSGKSTTAASLVARGAEIVADDFICVSRSGVVMGGASHVRLHEDSARAMNRLSTSLRGKRAWPLPRHAPDFDGDLSLFFLAYGDRLSIDPLQPVDALYMMMSNAYCGSLLDRPALASEFTRWSSLASAVPCFMLTRTRDIDKLDDVAALIEQHEIAAL